MLIVFYLFIMNVVLPKIGEYTQALIEPVMLIVITLAGIVMIFSAVGLKVSNNLGSTVVGGIFGAIGYIGKTIVQALAWIIKSTIRMIPKVFDKSTRVFDGMGMNPILTNVLSVFVTTMFVILII